MGLKKSLLVFGLGCVLIGVLVACSGENKSRKDLSDQDKIYVYESSVVPKYAELGDSFLRLAFEWEFGKDEDSMTKKTFMQSNISINAYQGEQMLILDPENSSGMGNSIYEKSPGNVSLAYKLVDNVTPVDFKVYWSELSSKDKPVKLTVDIQDLEPLK